MYKAEMKLQWRNSGWFPYKSYKFRALGGCGGKKRLLRAGIKNKGPWIREKRDFDLHFFSWGLGPFFYMIKVEKSSTETEARPA